MKRGYYLRLFGYFAGAKNPATVSDLEILFPNVTKRALFFVVKKMEKDGVLVSELKQKGIKRVWTKHYKLNRAKK